MRRERLLMCALALATVTAACMDGNCSQTQPTPLPTASPSPSPSASPTPVALGCDPVAVVTVSVIDHPNPLRVGVTYRLDATPKNEAREKLAPECTGKFVAWSLDGSTAVCVLSGDVEGFNPWIECSSPGRLIAKGCVTSPGGCGTVALDVVA